MKLMLFVFTIGVGLVSSAVAAEPQVVHVLLKADANGELESIYLDGKSVDPSPDGKLSRIDVLQSQVKSLVENPDSSRKAKEFAAEVEVESANLKYKYVSKVIIAITGYKRTDRAEPIPLIEKVKLMSSKKTPR